MAARSERLPPEELVSPSRLFWCYYENSTCSLWLWHCSRGGCLPWCASAGNACGEGMTGRERGRATEIEDIEGKGGGHGKDLTGKSEDDEGVDVD